MSAETDRPLKWRVVVRVYDGDKPVEPVVTINAKHIYNPNDMFSSTNVSFGPWKDNYLPGIAYINVGTPGRFSDPYRQFMLDLDFTIQNGTVIYKEVAIRSIRKTGAIPAGSTRIELTRMKYINKQNEETMVLVAPEILHGASTEKREIAGLTPYTREDIAKRRKKLERSGAIRSEESEAAKAMVKARYVTQTDKSVKLNVAPTSSADFTEETIANLTKVAEEMTSTEEGRKLKNKNKRANRKERRQNERAMAAELEISVDEYRKMRNEKQNIETDAPSVRTKNKEPEEDEASVDTPYKDALQKEPVTPEPEK